MSIRTKRLAIAIVAGCLAGALSAAYARAALTSSLLRPDFDQLWFSANAILHGRDPYSLVGPGREFEWPFRLNYPPPALVLLVPLGAMPLGLARFLFVGLGFAALAYAIASSRSHLAPILVSAAAYHAAIRGQWSPLFTASLVLPSFGAAHVAKPTIGAALWASLL